MTALARGLQQPIILLAVIAEVGELHPVTSAFDAEVADLTERRQEYAREYLDGIRTRLEADGVSASAFVAVGPVPETIVGTAEAQQAGLIAMATHGRVGLQRWFLGSVADKVVHTAPMPVLLIRPREEGAAAPSSIEHILLPLDGSPLAEGAIPYATRLAQAFNAPVTAIRAVPVDWAMSGDASGVEPSFSPDLLQTIEDDARQYLNTVASRLQAEGIAGSTHFAPFRHPADEIVDLAERTPGALIVMTTHGRSGLGRTLFGSVTDRVIRSSAAPVLVVQSSDAEQV